MRNAAAWLLAISLVACQKNSPPVALLSFQPGSGDTDTTFRFSAAGSHDRETPSGQLMYRWDWEGDQYFDTVFSNDSLADHRYPNAGTYTVWLEVMDPEGLVGSASLTLEVGESVGNACIDADGREYATVMVGTQLWMAENLAYLPSVSPPAVGATDFPHYYVPGYQGTDVAEAKKSENYGIYGVLYNWAAAKGSCPRGWRLPTDSDWQTLEVYLGMNEEEARSADLRLSGNVGFRLKSATGWLNNGNGDNSSGMNVLPAGYRFDSYDETKLLGGWVFLWSSSVTSDLYAWCRNFHSATTGIDRAPNLKSLGASVRCVRNR